MYSSRHEFHRGCREHRAATGVLDLVIQPGVELIDGVPTSVGLPYGSIPRLLLAWLTTEAVRTKERRLMLGETLSEFLEEIGLERTGGPRGGIARLRTQMRRLFSASVSATHTAQDGWVTAGVRVAHQAELWWDPKHPAQAAIWESSVTLSQEFYDEIVRRPIPVDLQALRVLKRSPLALDLYAWLTYRYSYLTKPTTIPWEALQLQFGADYAQTRQFKAKLLLALNKVHNVYPQAQVEPQITGLVLLPSRSHVARQLR